MCCEWRNSSARPSQVLTCDFQLALRRLALDEPARALGLDETRILCLVHLRRLPDDESRAEQVDQLARRLDGGRGRSFAGAHRLGDPLDRVLGRRLQWLPAAAPLDLWFWPRHWQTLERRLTDVQFRVLQLRRRQQELFLDVCRNSKREEEGERVPVSGVALFPRRFFLLSFSLFLFHFLASGK